MSATLAPLALESPNMQNPIAAVAVLLLSSSILAQNTATKSAGDWPGFRGADRSGAAADAQPPVTWSKEKNTVWTRYLPGAGSSSPIVVGDRVYVTCWSGYGLDADDPGDIEKLERHLVCIARATGEIVWDKTVAAPANELPYRGQVTTHGYATHTPVADLTRIYAHFGRAGVVAFDRDGKKLWHTPLARPKSAARGRSRGGRGGMTWGSAASPVVWGDLLIVNASEEAGSILALDKATGKIRWTHGSGLSASASSPLVATTKGGETSLICALSGAIVALDPASGKSRWTASIQSRGGPNSSPVADAERVYLITRQGVALRLDGGSDDTDGARVVWTTRRGSNIPSPVLHDGKIFIVDDRGTAACLNASTGELIHRGRLQGRVRGGVYASPVVAGGRLYVIGRRGTANVYSADGKFKLLAQNAFEGDKSEFNASPAVSGKHLFVRSDEFLYCLGSQ